MLRWQHCELLCYVKVDILQNVEMQYTDIINIYYGIKKKVRLYLINMLLNEKAKI
jgi:hypothetical protein